MLRKYFWITVLFALIAVLFIGCPTSDKVREEKCDECQNVLSFCVCIMPANAIVLGDFTWSLPNPENPGTPGVDYHSSPNQQGWANGDDLKKFVNAKTLVLKFEDPVIFDFSIVFSSSNLNWAQRLIPYDQVRGKFKNEPGVTVGKDEKIFTVDIPRLLGRDYAAYSNPSQGYANIILMYFGSGQDPLSDLNIIEAFLIPSPCPDCGEEKCVCDVCDVCGNDPCTCLPDGSVNLGSFNWTGDANAHQQGWDFDEEMTAKFKSAQSIVLKFENPLGGGIRFMFNGDAFETYVELYLVDTPQGIFTPSAGVQLSENRKEITVDIGMLMGLHYSKLAASTEWSSVVIMYWSTGGSGIDALGDVFAYLVVGNEIPVTNTNIILPAPVAGMDPVRSISTFAYNGVVTWDPPVTGSAFANSTTYKAIITLTALPPYSFDSVTVLTVNGNPATFNKQALTVEITFPETGIAKTFDGTLTVTGNHFTYQELTANYSGEGDDVVNYQWLRDNTVISGATENTYTPLFGGVYKVRLSASGYMPKESDDITVQATTTAGVDVNIGNVVQNVTMTAVGGTITGISDGAGYWFTKSSQYESSFVHFEITFPLDVYLPNFASVSFGYEGVSGALNYKPVSLIGGSSLADLGSTNINRNNAVTPNVQISNVQTLSQINLDITQSSVSKYNNTSTVFFSIYIHQEMQENGIPTSYKISNITFNKGEPCSDCGFYPCECTCADCSAEPCICVLKFSTELVFTPTSGYGSGTISANSLTLIQEARPGSIVRLFLVNNSGDDRSVWGCGHFGDALFDGVPVSGGTRDISVASIVSNQTNVYGDNLVWISKAELWTLQAP